MAASLEDIIETDKVGLDVSSRIGDAVAHSGLGGKVHYNLRLILSKDIVNQLLISYIATNERKVRV